MVWPFEHDLHAQAHAQNMSRTFAACKLYFCRALAMCLDLLLSWSCRCPYTLPRRWAEFKQLFQLVENLRKTQPGTSSTARTHAPTHCAPLTLCPAHTPRPNNHSTLRRCSWCLHQREQVQLCRTMTRKLSSLVISPAQLCNVLGVVPFLSCIRVYGVQGRAGLRRVSAAKTSIRCWHGPPKMEPSAIRYVMAVCCSCVALGGPRNVHMGTRLMNVSWWCLGSTLSHAAMVLIGPFAWQHSASNCGAFRFLSQDGVPSERTEMSLPLHR